MRKTLIATLFGTVLGLAVLAGAGLYIYNLLQPVSTQPSDEVVQFVVPRGAALTAVADKLETQGLVRSALAFRLMGQAQGLDSSLQAGSFKLQPSMTLVEIIETLSKGTEDTWVTIPEGLRVEEIADRLAAAGLTEFDRDEFIRLAKDSEGQLFPDTYLLPKAIGEAQVFDLLTNTFQQKIVQDMSEELRESEYDLPTVVTLASLVQREAKSYEDMRRVAGIIGNRLEIEMKLDIDATLQYARGFDEEKNNWWTQPDASWKEAVSPYNTYLNPGLPPGPICNPGKEAIAAVLDPIPSDDLFYLHTPTGEMYFAKTLQEHSANVDRYLR